MGSYRIQPDGIPDINEREAKKRENMEHRIYYGFLKNDHYFVEVKKNLFEEWNKKDIENISRKDIEEWNKKEEGSKSHNMLMTLSYIKQGCGCTVRLLKTIK